VPPKVTLAKSERQRDGFTFLEALQKLVVLPEFAVFLRENAKIRLRPRHRTLNNETEHDELMRAQGGIRAIKEFIDVNGLLDKLIKDSKEYDQDE
jgi:hypothetical protein